MSSKKSIGNNFMVAIKKWPVHFLLLPTFFMLHNYVNLAALVSKEYFIKNYVFLLLSFLFVFLISKLYYKEKDKAGVYTSILGFVFLFFGQIKDLLHLVSFLKIISSYAILIPTLIALLVIVGKKIKKSKSIPSITFFLNLLLITYLAIETYNLNNLYRSNTSAYTYSFSDTKKTFNKKLPDIYYIVLDGYPSSSFLKERLNIAVNSFDSSLIKKGFFIAKNSSSNYNYTAFSIASVFTMSYLSWLNKSSSPSPEDYHKASMQIKNAPLFEWLKQNNYTINNNSFFNICNENAITDTKFFFIISSDIVFRNTLWKRIKWEVIPKLFPSYIKKLQQEQSTEIKTKITDYKNYDNEVYNLLLQKQNADKKKSFFTYAHFQMPHPPYLYDSSGNEYELSELYSQNIDLRKKMYTSYIAYVNQKISSAIDSIMINCTIPPVIVIQSDHGCREGFISNKPEHSFRNYSAFYFPDNNYKMLNDSLSNVNTFRIIGNKYFNQKMPLLQDSTVFLKF